MYALQLEAELTEDSEQDVDEQIRSAAALEEDTHGGQDDGENDLADIATQDITTKLAKYSFDLTNPSNM